MSEIEKLYKLAEVNHRVEILDCFPSCEVITPPFTTEKQLKILCFIVNNKHSVTFHDQIFGGDKLTLDKIQEDLAWAINRIWQDLTDVEKEEIRKILKG